MQRAYRTAHVPYINYYGCKTLTYEHYKLKVKKIQYAFITQ